MGLVRTDILKSPLTAVYAWRALRDFGEGFMALLLPVYLLALGYGALEIGMIAAISLAGSALLTLVMGQLAARLEFRALLMAASLLMVLSGVTIAATEEIWIILIVALCGTINPSAGNTSLFIPIEHAVIAAASGGADRARSFAIYGFAGAMAAAVGALAIGLADVRPAGMNELTALRMMFMFYSVLGVLAAMLYARVPAMPQQRATSGQTLGPSRRRVLGLAALFSVDAFAGGFVVQSLLALWLFERHGLSLTAAGAFFFATGLLSAASQLLAAALAKRIGLLNTMVITHIPSSVALVLAALAPNLPIVLALLTFRAALSQMDVPARSAFVMALVTPEERPAAASFTSVPRSLAAAISPALGGALLAAGFGAAPLLLCGGLKIAYDLALFAAYRRVVPPDER